MYYRMESLNLKNLKFINNLYFFSLEIFPPPIEPFELLQSIEIPLLQTYSFIQRTY